MKNTPPATEHCLEQNGSAQFLLVSSVTQRRQELGIRMALGAHPGDILSLVLKRGMKLTLIGMALGLMGAVASTRLLRDMLFGIKPVDPLTFCSHDTLIDVHLARCLLPACTPRDES
ncbi:MAG TPA: FtsX-like permease family protein [Pyrinomonadaceae bacterium]|nr:FtsX-like permease family protein [Pyrinomonadaceae bacterium]